MYDFISKSILILLKIELDTLIITSFLFFYFFIFFYKQKKVILKIFSLFVPFFFVYYKFSALPDYFSSLGQDSFFETKADFGEAIFFLKSFLIFLFDPIIFEKKRFWLLLISSFVFGYLIFKFIILFQKNKKNTIFQFKILGKIYILVFIIGIINISFISYKYYQMGSNLRSEIFSQKKEIEKNLKNLDLYKNKKKNLLLVTYIGESTSALNFSLYGYPFNTTPYLNKLKNKDNFLLFTNVYSRFVQTSFSLIDSLAICLNNQSYCLTSNFLPIVEILKKVNVNTHLMSSQGNLGGHNLAEQIVLDTTKKEFSANKTEIQKGFSYIPKKKDDQFFTESFCKNKNIFEKNSDDIVFLHSYAGHGAFGGYDKLIDSNKIKFSYPNSIDKKNFLGSDTKNFELILGYDTAIKYIDYSLNSILDCSIKNSEKNKKPMIFLYFSDHGESAFTARLHDPNNLTYEMIHVPFFIYFNEKAIEEFQAEFNYLKELKSENLTLKILNNIFLDLFNVKIYFKNKNNINNENLLIKNLDSDYLVPRTLLENENEKHNGKVTLWKTKFQKGLLSKFFDEKVLRSQDIGITNWQLNNYLIFNNFTNQKAIEKLICQSNASSIILQLKSSISINCFELPVYFFENHITVGNNLNSAKPFLLDLSQVVKYDKKQTIWLNIKNNLSEQECDYAKNWVSKNIASFESLLIEFSGSIKNLSNSKLAECIKEINFNEKVKITVPLDNNISSECLNLNLYIKDTFIKNCKQELLNFKNFLDINTIDSVVVDYKLLKEFLPYHKAFDKFKLNIKNLNDINNFEELIIRENIGAISFKNNDNLNNIN